MHPWPGNVRELENVMQRALVLCDGNLIEPSHLRFEILPQVDAAGVAAKVAAASPTAVPALPAPEAQLELTSAGDLARAVKATEARLLLEALRSRVESRERIAQRLGISPRTLRYKLARLRAAGIDLDAAIGSAA
jgi:two-component system response regulator FlrC